MEIIGTEEQKIAIFAALAKAQAVATNPAKTAENVDCNSGYTPLFTLTNLVRSIFAPLGLSVVQMHDGGTLTTLITHVEGGCIKAAANLVGVTSGGIYALGSAITYQRRYALMGLLNIASHDDDDGQAAAAEAAKVVNDARTGGRTAAPRAGEVRSGVDSTLVKPTTARARSVSTPVPAAAAPVPTPPARTPTNSTPVSAPAAPVPAPATTLITDPTSGEVGRAKTTISVAGLHQMTSFEVAIKKKYGGDAAKVLLEALATRKATLSANTGDAPASATSPD